MALSHSLCLSLFGHLVRFPLAHTCAIRWFDHVCIYGKNIRLFGWLYASVVNWDEQVVVGRFEILFAFAAALIAMRASELHTLTQTHTCIQHNRAQPSSHTHFFEMNNYTRIEHQQHAKFADGVKCTRRSARRDKRRDDDANAKQRRIRCGWGKSHIAYIWITQLHLLHYSLQRGVASAAHVLHKLSTLAVICCMNEKLVSWIWIIFIWYL